MLAVGTRSDSPGKDDRGDRASARLGNQAQTFTNWCVKWAKHNGEGSVALRSLSLYPPSASRNGDWLVVAKGFDGGYKCVAFHRASEPLTALLGFFQRWAEGKLTWKPDEYAKD